MEGASTGRSGGRRARGGHLTRDAAHRIARRVTQERQREPARA
ncbi:hypothetical protein [Kineosporia mesophila]|nr:hypothetical protein [Kineosporia mesophila]